MSVHLLSLTTFQILFSSLSIPLPPSASPSTPPPPQHLSLSVCIYLFSISISFLSSASLLSHDFSSLSFLSFNLSFRHHFQQSSFSFVIISLLNHLLPSAYLQHLSAAPSLIQHLPASASLSSTSLSSLPPVSISCRSSTYIFASISSQHLSFSIFLLQYFPFSASFSLTILIHQHPLSFNIILFQYCPSSAFFSLSISPPQHSQHHLPTSLVSITSILSLSLKIPTYFFASITSHQHHPYLSSPTPSYIISLHYHPFLAPCLRILSSSSLASISSTYLLFSPYFFVGVFLSQHPSSVSR